MTLTTSQSPITAGQQVTFTAHVSANAPSTLTPAGSVTFVDTTNNVTLGTAPLDQNGDAKLQVTLTKAGTITIQASYNTDNNYATSSATVDETVNPGPTSRFAVVAPASVVAGTTFSFTVTAQDPFQNTTPSYAGIIHFTSSD